MQTPDLDRKSNVRTYCCVPEMPVADIEFFHVMQNLDHEILTNWIFSCVVRNPRLLNPSCWFPRALASCVD